MGTRETNVEGYLDEQVALLGGITRKFVSPGHRGVPDRIVIAHGFVIFVEVKVHDGVLEDWQEREINKLIAHGAMTSVLYGRGAIDTFIAGLKTMILEKRAKKR